MSKLSKIKEKLASLIIEVEFESIKTDKAVLQYDGELAVDIEIFVIDEATGERVPAADGEYVTEENKVITVADGKVISIVEKEETPEETPAEAENPTEDVVAEDAPEGTEGETTEDTPKEETDEVAELKTRIDELEETVAKLIDLIDGMKKETEEKFSKISLAKPATEEFEQVKETKKTGDAKLDKFLARYGNK